MDSDTGMPFGDDQAGLSGGREQEWRGMWLNSLRTEKALYASFTPTFSPELNLDVKR
jgi:hypothetical protein